MGCDCQGKLFSHVYKVWHIKGYLDYQSGILRNISLEFVAVVEFNHPSLDALKYLYIWRVRLKVVRP